MRERFNRRSAQAFRPDGQNRREPGPPPFQPRLPILDSRLPPSHLPVPPRDRVRPAGRSRRSPAALRRRVPRAHRPLSSAPRLPQRLVPRSSPARGLPWQVPVSRPRRWRQWRPVRARPVAVLQIRFRWRGFAHQRLVPTPTAETVGETRRVSRRHGRSGSLSHHPFRLPFQNGDLSGRSTRGGDIVLPTHGTLTTGGGR